MTYWERGEWHWCIVDAACYIGWADHWQTMIAGLTAVGAAGWAAWLAKGQLGAAREQVSAARDQLRAQLDDQADVRSRSLRAARSSLPGVLTAICDHAEQVSAALKSAWPTADLMYPDEGDAFRARTVTGEVPRFPQELIAPLHEVLRHADDGAVLARIASIFREAQVLDARTRPLGIGAEISLNELASYLLEAATLYARAVSLFSFARGHGDTVDPGDLWDRVFVALDIMRVQFPLVSEKARGERDAGLPPGEADTLPAI